MKCSRVTIHFLVISFCWCGSALADGVMRDGQGAISSGRGGTNIAFSDNGAIVHDNPAGMVNIGGCGRSEFGVAGLLAGVSYEDDDNSIVDAERTPYPLGYLSLIQKSADGRFAAGIGMFAPAGFGAEYEMVNNDFAGPDNTHHYKSFGALARILPAVAYKPTDRLAIGATLGVAVSHTELEGPFYTQTGGAPGTPMLFDMQGTGAALTWSAGLQYQLTDRTVVGAVYQNANSFDLNGSAVIESDLLPGKSRYEMDAEITWPQSVGVGVMHRLGDNQTLSFDAIWFDWASAFDSLDIRMTDPSNDAYKLALGDPVTDSFPLNWEDSISFRTGYERLLSRNSVGRLGYVYHANPVPNGTLTPFIPATLEHQISAGYGRTWGNHELNLAYAFAFGPDEEVGLSDIEGGDFENSRIEATAHWLMISFSKRW